MNDLKIFAKTIEDSALEQINTLMVQSAFCDCKVRIMPDVHAGAGCVIGFTANLGNKVIPNIVGVDIGCGMRVINLGQIDVDYAKLDNIIKQQIPSGRAVHNNKYIYEDINKLRCFIELKNIDRLNNSLGTLGGGNHFIEIDEGSDGTKYLVIHTGSRNLGKQVADIYTKHAVDSIAQQSFIDTKKIIDRMKAEGRQSEIKETLSQIKKPTIHPDFCYLEGVLREDYLHDMRICQRFAESNRSTIADTICRAMDWGCVSWFESVHNYISIDGMVRKGAISAAKDQEVIIPMNMRDGCILGVGKGNEDWNCSAPHGAGRIMSRSQARRELDMDIYTKSMEGIYTTSVVDSTIDEAPQAYKPMEEIVESICDTVDIIDIIKPVYNFKAAE